MLFNKIQAAQNDPILGLSEAFDADTRLNKVNLSIGIYQDEHGHTPIMKAVKEAEKRLLETEHAKSYLNMDGLADYNEQTQILLFGADSEIIASRRAKTAQSLGGTGALRIAAEFIRHQAQVKNIWVSEPTWPNHHAIFKAAGINVCHYRYYDPATYSLDWQGLIADLDQVQADDVVLWHGCCHNPTGVDPTPEQWNRLAEMSAERGWLPLFDFAYQGLAAGLEQDAYGLRTFAQCHHELLVASSYSKNFGLYNERAGVFTLVANDAETADCSFSQVKSIIRTLYSNPAFHGAAAVALVLQDKGLRAQWIAELDGMCARIQNMRNKLVDLLKEYGVKQDFGFIVKQNGMFSFSGLTAEQIDRLRDEFAIYAVRSGRINIAGITDNNIRYLCESIAKVL